MFIEVPQVNLLFTVSAVHLTKICYACQKLQQQKLDVTESVLLGSQRMGLQVDIVVVIG